MVNNMYTDGTYFKNKPEWDVKDSKWKAMIIADLLKKNKITFNTITEVGCGAGEVLNSISNIFDNSNANLSGYDISPQAINIAKKIERENLKFYNEDITQQNVHSDILLVIDVVEHVEDYYTFLEKLKSKATYFVFHIPLDFSCRTILKPNVLLQQRSSVGHVHYFSKELVEWALKDKGYTIIDWHYTKPRLDTEPAAGVKNFIKKNLRNISFTLNKNVSAKLWGGYSMMILAN